MSEHHLTPDGFLPSPLVMSAAIAARTRRIRIGTNILVLPLHHPLRVGEDAAVADLISGGRMILGLGRGYAEREFAAFGVDRRHRSHIPCPVRITVPDLLTGLRFDIREVVRSPVGDREVSDALVEGVAGGVGSVREQDDISRACGQRGSAHLDCHGAGVAAAA